MDNKMESLAISQEGFAVLKNDLLPDKTMIVSPDVFKLLMQPTPPQPTPREQALLNKIREYYQATKKVNRKQVHKLSQELRFWVTQSGYTPDEFNRAKREVLMNG